MNPDTMFPKIQYEESPRRRFSKFFIALCCVVVIAIGSGTYFYVKNKILYSVGSSYLAQDTKKLIENVGKIFILPTGEDPTVATVSDPEKIRNQPFFAHAKTGDKVLIYTKARKAFLYRESEKKLVEVASLNEENPSSIKDSVK